MIFGKIKVEVSVALHVRVSFLSISLPSSAKQQREIAKFEVLIYRFSQA